MAKVGLGSLVGGVTVDPIETPVKEQAASVPAGAEVRGKAEGPKVRSATAGPSSVSAGPEAESANEPLVRINFQVPVELRQRFKVWAAMNDTTITDELTRHIQALVG